VVAVLLIFHGFGDQFGLHLRSQGYGYDHRQKYEYDFSHNLPLWWHRLSSLCGAG
jgi:hypothetical protein